MTNSFEILKRDLLFICQVWYEQEMDAKPKGHSKAEWDEITIAAMRSALIELEQEVDDKIDDGC